MNRFENEYKPFKTLVFKTQSVYKCRYAVIMNLEVYETEIPTLLPMSSTMKALKDLFPHIDLSEVEMVEVNLYDKEIRREWLTDDEIDNYGKE